MITKSEAKALMFSEIKCQECNGIGYREKNGSNTVLQDDTSLCPTCSGKGVIIEDVIMKIIDCLTSAWRSGMDTFNDKHLQDIVRSYVPKWLTKALLLLLALADVLGVEMNTKQIANYKHPNMKILHLLTFPMVIWGLVRDDPTGLTSILKIKISWFYSDFMQYCKQNSINIEYHIKDYQENKS